MPTDSPSITGAVPTPEPASQDRMIVIGRGPDERSLAEALRANYPDCLVIVCDSHLSAVASVSREPARAIIACMDTAFAQLENALAGLRMAAGAKTRIVLCCLPETEPIARRMMTRGADDYVLFPLEAEELDAALGYLRGAHLTGQGLAAAPVASMAELDALGKTLEAISASPSVLLQRIAELVRTALHARGATIIVEGAATSDGVVTTQPVLSAPVMGDAGVIGQLAVSERASGPYRPADTDKLSHYARLMGHVLRSASKQRQWRQLAVTDECTGLPNRRFLRERLQEILTRANLERFSVSVVLFDVDDFKSYNDRYGHAAGDTIIRVVGRLFRQHCRDQDIVTRYGGDEFAVVFWDPEGPRVAGSRHPDCALGVLERFSASLAGRRFCELDALGNGRVTISAGLASYPWDGETVEALIGSADDALLAAKRAGKNRVFIVREGSPESQEV